MNLYILTNLLFWKKSIWDNVCSKKRLNVYICIPKFSSISYICKSEHLHCTKTIAFCPWKTIQFHSNIGQLKVYIRVMTGSNLSQILNFTFTLTLDWWVVSITCSHTTYSWNIKWKKWTGMGLNGFIFKKVNVMKMKTLKQKNTGSRLEVAC